MAALLRFVLALGLMLGSATAWCAIRPLSLSPGNEIFSNGVQFPLAGGGDLRIEFLAHGTVRIEARPAGVASLLTGAVISITPAAGTVETFEDEARFMLRQAGLNVVVTKNPLQVVVLRDDGSIISATVPGGLQADSSTGLVVALLHARPGERYFGMGLAGGPLDRRGRSLTMRNKDNAAYGELTNPLYSSTPFYYGHVGGATHGLFLDNPTTAVFDFGASNPEALSIGATGGTLNYYVMAGPTPAAVASAFTALTGATPVPPRWALGYQQAHFGYASAEQVLGLAREFRARAIPADAFYLDLDYTDHLFTFTWNPLTWPNPKGFNDEMESLGFKRVNILEPLVTVFDPRWSIAANNSLLVTYPGGSPLVTNIWMGDVSFFDFTKQAARDYFRGELKTFVATGVSGLWADLNEPAANDMPWGVYDFEGSPRYDYAGRNTYALWEAATLRDALLEAQPMLRPFIVSRSGFAGIQRYAANWSGDTDSTWDSLRVQVQIANHMGLSGQNFFGADIGGFLGAPDAELFLRWLQFGAATPYMRNHSINTVPQREPWRYGEPYTAAAKAIIEWRYRLMPYLYGQFVQAEASGAPVLAPTFFHFPADAATQTGNSEFMLGKALLVAPVFTPGAASRSLYLPAGANWVDYYTDALHAGGQTVTVNAPIHQLPLLVRAGSIVPMGPVRQYASQVLAGESLTLDIFAGADGNFTLRDDDGATLAYRNGAYRDTLLSWRETTAAAELTAGNAGGSLTPAGRTWWLQVRRWATAPTRVLADGAVLPRAADPGLIPATGGWAHAAATGRLFVRLPGAQVSQTVRIER